MAKEPPSVISHWNKLIENFNASPIEFYTLVERALREREVPEAGTSRVDYREGGVLSARREYLRVSRGRHVFDICGAPFGTGFFVSSWLAETRSSAGLLYLVGLAAALPAAGFLGFVALVTIFGWGTGFLLAILGLPVAFFVGLPLLFWLVGMQASQNHGALEDALLETPFVGALYERLFRPTTYYRVDTAMMFQQAVHAAVLAAVDAMTAAKGVRSLSELERKPALPALNP